MPQNAFGMCLLPLLKALWWCELPLQASVKKQNTLDHRMKPTEEKGRRGFPSKVVLR